MNIKKRKYKNKSIKQLNKYGILMQTDRPPRKRYFPGEKVED